MTTQNPFGHGGVVSATGILWENHGTINVRLDLRVECAMHFTLGNGQTSAFWQSWGGCYRVDKREWDPSLNYTKQPLLFLLHAAQPNLNILSLPLQRRFFRSGKTTIPRFQQSLTLGGCFVCFFYPQLIQIRYAETVDLLYSDITIQISNIVLVQHFHSLLLPQRLTNISSLVLVWDLLRLSEGDHTPSGNLAVYSNLMTRVSKTFPSLKKLHIWVDASSSIRDPEYVDIDAYERRLLEPADALAQRHHSRLSDFQLAPNRTLYTALMRRAEKGGSRIEKRGTGLGSFHGFWRPATADCESPGTGIAGYWVRAGSDDTPL